MNLDPANAPSSLKARLAQLDAPQTAALRQRLAKRQADDASRAVALTAIPRARPLRIEEDPPMAIFPASRGQQRLFFLQTLSPKSPAYAIPIAFHLRGLLQVRWLEDALRAVIRRHAALRTTFTLDASGIVQQVAADFRICLEQDSLEAVPNGGLRDAADRRLRDVIVRPFHLEAEPPIRGLLIRLRSNEHLLLMVVHHILFDGWSRAILLHDLSTAYASLAAGLPADLPPLPLQPADVSAWQTAQEDAGGLAHQEAYWVTALAGNLTPLNLPADRLRPAMPSFRGNCRRRPLNPALRTQLEARAGEEGATLFMLLLTGYAVLLRRETGRLDLIIGTPIAGRPRIEVEPLIGFFVNTLPLPITLADGTPLRDLLRHVREITLNAHAHPDLPLDRLIDRLSLPRDPSRHLLVSVTFAVRTPSNEVLNLPGIEATAWEVNTQSSKFDLSLTVELSSGGWTAVAEYSTDLFEAPRVDRLLADWETLLVGTAENPDQSVGELIATTDAGSGKIGGP